MIEHEIINKLKGIKELPTLPAIAMELNKMLQSSESTVDSVANHIEKDQAIATKVLKLINSAFFGVRSKVGSIHDAVVLLGFNSVRNIVLSVSVIKAFSNNVGGAEFDISSFWKHSIAVAMTSKHISTLSRVADPEDCFTAGLLHDIGKIIIAQHFGDTLSEILGKIEKENLSFSKAEKEVVGKMGHAKIGAFLADKWRFPTNLTETIKNHHSANGILSETGAIVHLGNIIVHVQEISTSTLTVEEKKGRMPIINPKSLEKFRQYFASSNEWYPQLEEKIHEASSFFVDS